jgi:hypothetical protein
LTGVLTVTDSPSASDLLRRLAVAGWGACCGVLIATAATAALIAVNGDTEDLPHPALLSSSYLKCYEVVPWQERYERMWYALLCVTGPLCGWAAARVLRLPPVLAGVAAVAFVPLANWACEGVFAADPSIERLLACAGVLAVPLLRLSVRAGSVSVAPEPVADASGSDRGPCGSHRRAALPAAGGAAGRGARAAPRPDRGQRVQ